MHNTFNISRKFLVGTASDLLSENGENPEYDRALIELVGICLGFSPADQRYSIEFLLREVKWWRSVNEA